jgi:hypothetical protein
MISSFEDRVRRKQEEVLRSFLIVPLGDFHNYSRLKGVYEGLEKSLELYREASKGDLEAGEH